MLISHSYFFSQTRTDHQLELDRDWLSMKKVWLVHKGGFSSGHMTTGIHANDLQGNVKVTIDFNGKELMVDEDDVEKVGRDDSIPAIYVWGI